MLFKGKCRECNKRVWNRGGWCRVYGLLFHTDCLRDIVFYNDTNIFFHDNNLNTPSHDGSKKPMRCSECAGTMMVLDAIKFRRGREHVWFHEHCAVDRAYNNCEKTIAKLYGLKLYPNTDSIDDIELETAIQKAPNNTTYRGTMPKGYATMTTG